MRRSPTRKGDQASVVASSEHIEGNTNFINRREFTRRRGNDENYIDTLSEDTSIEAQNTLARCLRSLSINPQPETVTSDRHRSSSSHPDFKTDIKSKFITGSSTRDSLAANAKMDVSPKAFCKEEHFSSLSSTTDALLLENVAENSTTIVAEIVPENRLSEISTKMPDVVQTPTDSPIMSFSVTAALARAPIRTDPRQLPATNPEKPTTILDTKVLDCGAGIIKPFHTPKSSTQRALRVSPPVCVAHNVTTNKYNRVRRRSPLCHDVLDFMLEGASTSSQESLLICSAMAKDGKPNSCQERSVTGSRQMSRAARTETYAPHSSNSLQCTLTAAVIATDTDQAHSDYARLADTAHLAQTTAYRASISNGTCIGHSVNSHATIQGSGLVRKPSELSDISGISDDDGTSDGNDSDSSADFVSDNGFDGQCDMLSLTASAKSTAECSRSVSCKSSASRDSSVTSEGSTTTTTSTEPSLSWWRRHFRTTRSKLPTQPQDPVLSGSLLRRSTIGGHPEALKSTNWSSLPPENNRTTFSNNPKARAPILTRLRRTMSSKSVAIKLLTPESKKRHMVSPTAATSSQSKLPRSSLMSLSHKLPEEHVKPVAAGATVSSNVTPERVDTSDCLSTTNYRTEDGFNLRWKMLMCKGTADLHVVSVPTNISSMNHKDTFLLYPCLLRNQGMRQTSTDMEYLSVEERASVKHSSKRNTDIHTSTRDSALLDREEYKNKTCKSVCSLASHVVYVWLGTHSSAIKRDAITRVAIEIRDREMTGRAAIVIVDETAAADSARKKFFAQLYSAQNGSHVSLPGEMSTIYSQITPLSRAGNDMNFERALQRRKVMYGFWEAIPPATIISTGKYVNAAALLKVPMGGVVVLDTWSDVFVWWRDEPCSTAVRKCAIDFASMLVKDACIPPRPESASIWHEVHGSEHVIFKTKFSDWPFVFASSMGTAEVVDYIEPNPDSAMPSITLPVRSVSYSVQPLAVI
ncbi:hypothetical protein COEREDRAFT_82702 [Coemansia reversa NRRL 1564]|uniref:Gelsolin-like domain-containing protein n=1 Tax=Coemansia reversa (strain ATCC 12441 / NRRL 1564) TaxID=763665 RepID=A0A2G5B5Z0_COERN|nr:hypothetical protein COEREDRAFT_82702 [Coemansia reversa NRRL 1564]|eukprot:PIA14412.1 hypothetical protein COEREDRAFT_82702 [Coemansia reversa NRRL 1564]